MKISEIPVKESITSSEIQDGYMLGMKNIYPEDDVPVYELQRFPLMAFISDIDLDVTKQMIKRMRNINSDVVEQKTKLEKLVSNIKPVTLTDIESADLQTNDGVIDYDSVTSQLITKFATPDELQTSVNNVYSALFNTVEDMMVQIFTTSMYARQYVPIAEDPEVDYSEYQKYQH